MAIPSVLRLVYEHLHGLPGGVDVLHAYTLCQTGVYWLDFLLLLFFLIIDPEEAS